MKKRLKKIKPPRLTSEEREINQKFYNAQYKAKKKMQGFVQISCWVPKKMRKALISRVQNIVKEYEILGIDDTNYVQKLSELEKLKEDHGDYEIHYVEDGNDE